MKYIISFIFLLILGMTKTSFHYMKSKIKWEQTIGHMRTNEWRPHAHHDHAVISASVIEACYYFPREQEANIPYLIRAHVSPQTFELKVAGR